MPVAITSDDAQQFNDGYHCYTAGGCPFDEHSMNYEVDCDQWLIGFAWAMYQDIFSGTVAFDFAAGKELAAKMSAAIKQEAP